MRHPKKPSLLIMLPVDLKQEVSALLQLQGRMNPPHPQNSHQRPLVGNWRKKKKIFFFLSPTSQDMFINLFLYYKDSLMLHISFEIGPSLLPLFSCLPKKKKNTTPQSLLFIILYTQNKCTCDSKYWCVGELVQKFYWG